MDLPPPIPELVEPVDAETVFSRSQVDGAFFFKAQKAKANSAFDGIIDIPDDSTFETALILNVSKDNAVLRTRFTSLTPQNSDDRSDVLDASVLEAALDVYPTDRVDIRLGKTFLSWDPGFSTQPNGFFQGHPDFADITDFENRLEGVFLLSMTYATELLDIGIVVAEAPDDPRLGADQPDSQAAVRLVGDIAQTTFALILRGTDTENSGLGITASTTLTANATGQLSVFSDKLATRAAIGGSVFLKTGITIAVELSYDELNETQEESSFIALTPPRKFWDTRISRNDFDLNWSISLRHSFEDDSYLLAAALATTLDQNIQLRFEAGGYSEPDTGALGRIPIESFSSLSLKVAF